MELSSKTVCGPDGDAEPAISERHCLPSLKIRLAQDNIGSANHTWSINVKSAFPPGSCRIGPRRLSVSEDRKSLTDQNQKNELYDQPLHLHPFCILHNLAVTSRGQSYPTMAGTSRPVSRQ